MPRDDILAFWQSQARRHGTDHTASWGDLHAIRLEIDAIGRHLRPGQEVLDVGCANGYSSCKQLSHQPARFVGVDFAPEMVAQALRRRARLPATQRALVSFQEGDVRALPFPDASFDVVYTTRVLINLPTWAEQQRGISECLRVCRPEAQWYYQRHSGSRFAG